MKCAGQHLNRTTLMSNVDGMVVPTQIYWGCANQTTQIFLRYINDGWKISLNILKLFDTAQICFVISINYLSWASQNMKLAGIYFFMNFEPSLNQVNPKFGQELYYN